MGQPSDAVTGVPFFFLHFHLKIEEKKKVGTPVNQASRRWLHHVGPTVSAWFFLLLLFPSHREEGRGRRKRRKQERYHGHGHLWNKVQDRDSCQIAWFLTSFSTLLPAACARRRRRVDGEVNPGGHVLGGRSPHTKKRKTSAQNTAQDRDFTIRYRPSHRLFSFKKDGEDGIYLFPIPFPHGH